jgi:surface antigen
MQGWNKTTTEGGSRGGAGRIGAAWRLAAGLLAITQMVPHAAMARPAGLATEAEAGTDSDDSDALPYLQCVPFARSASGINLYGDALTWWDQAEGRYARGHVPQVGAVMSFRPYHAMQLGHVAMVSRVIDQRTVLLRHANWSPIEGRRGQVEMDVRAVDVSPDNSWSEVRVWYAPIGDLGTTHWPVNGFIYKGRAPRGERATVLAEADAPRVTRLSAVAAPGGSRIDAGFLTGITPERGTSAPRTTGARAARPTRNWLMATPEAPSRPGPATLNPALRDDPIGRIIARRMTRGEG